jgi:non-ribosomal peptide synthetase component F
MEKTEADVDKWEDDSHTARGITVLTGTQAVHYATVERLQVAEEEISIYNAYIYTY